MFIYIKYVLLATKYSFKKKFKKCNHLINYMHKTRSIGMLQQQKKSINNMHQRLPLVYVLVDFFVRCNFFQTESLKVLILDKNQNCMGG